MRAPKPIDVAPLDDSASELDRILKHELIQSAYQPIVDLESGETVGYEALARGPKGSPLEFPDRLFETAREVGRLAELDWECRAAALRGALANGLLAPMLLFVNVEPEAAFVRPPDHLWPLLEETTKRLRLICEFTERGVVERPNDIINAARVWRNAGMSIALDDVNADPHSLAMLPILRPEIIKLDMSIVQTECVSEIVDTLHTVNSWAERAGAIVLAEGVETDQHLQRALTLGADYGQGWKYGKPIPLTDFTPEPPRKPSTISLPGRREINKCNTPYNLLSAQRATRLGSKQLVQTLARQIEEIAQVMGPTGVMIGTFRKSRHFDATTRMKYRRAADVLAFVGALGDDLHSGRDGAMWCMTTDGDDPIAAEWIVCTISPHYCATLVAKDVGDADTDPEQRFSFCMTHDHDLCGNIAKMLIERVAPMADRTAPGKLRLVD